MWCQGCWLAQCLWVMPAIPWERPTDPPGIPAKPQKRLCSPGWNKSGIEASLFWFHATVKSTALKGAPAAPVHENWQQALSINRAPNMRNPPKKGRQHNVFPADSSIQQKRQAMKGWRRALQKGSLLCPVTEWWLTLGWNGHCSSHLLQRRQEWKGQRRIEVMYPSMALGTPWWLPLLVLVWDLAPLGWTTNPPSGRKVVLDS